MKRRVPLRSADDVPPEHLLVLDPARYRRVAALVLKDHPGDWWAAAFAIWRVWQDEAIEWQAERGIVWGMKAWQHQLGPGNPPSAWVREEFGLTGSNIMNSICPDGCRAHSRGLRH